MSTCEPVGIGRVVSVNISERKTVRKPPGAQGVLVPDRGFEGDAHAGDWHRQVSLLAEESIATMRAKGLDVGPGDFAENITTTGIDLMRLPIGTTLALGPEAVVEVSQIGKVCHTKCAIYYQAGDCVMPKEGIFAVVRSGGKVSSGDEIRVISLGDGTCDHPSIAEGRELAEEGPKREALQERARSIGNLGVAEVRELRMGILTCSDSRSKGMEEDTAGHALVDICSERGWVVVSYHVTPDDTEHITASLIDMADLDRCDVVLTVGGTGLGPRDVAPEATLAVSEREVPGIAEAIRADSMKVTRRAMLSRGVAVTRGRTLVVNLPGSEKAARETFAVIADQLEHAVEMMAGGGHDGSAGRRSEAAGQAASATSSEAE